MTARSISRSVASPFARSIVGRLLPWTPAKLFSAGQQGLWLEASPTYKDQQVLWQQSDGTVIVDANGDPVGRADDLSPNGNNATQPTSANRPTYNTDGSLHWLGFDGVSKHLAVLDDEPKTHPYAAIGNQCSGFFAVRFDALNAAQTVDNWLISSVIHEIRNLGNQDVHVPFSFGANGDKVAFGCASNYTNSATRVNGVTSLSTGQNYIIGFVVDGTNLSLYINGQVDATSSSLGTNSRSPADGTGNASSRLGIRTRDDNGLADPLNGRVIAFEVVDYAMSQAQIDDVNSHLANLAGVTL